MAKHGKRIPLTFSNMIFCEMKNILEELCPTTMSNNSEYEESCSKYFVQHTSVEVRLMAVKIRGKRVKNCLRAFKRKSVQVRKEGKYQNLYKYQYRLGAFKIEGKENVLKERKR